MEDTDKISNDSNEDLNIDLSKLVNIFLRRKFLFSISSILLFTFFTLQTFYERRYNPLYKGEFKILINDPINNSGSFSSVSEGSFITTAGTTNVTSNVIEFLLSDQTLNPVAKKFNISNEKLRKTINIEAGGFNISNSALTITIKDSQIERGQNKLNLLSERFEKVSLEQKQQKIKSGLTFINKLLPELEFNVLQIQNELVDLREKNNIVTPIIESEALKARLFDIEQKISVAKNKFQPDSIIMKNLIQERNTFLNSFKNQPELIKKYENFQKKLQLAENIYEKYVSTKQQLELDLARENIPFKIISKPYMNPTIVYPSIFGNLRRGLAISVFLAFIVILIRDRIDNVFHSISEVEKEFKKPILAKIPYSLRFSELRTSKGSINEALSSDNLSNYPKNVKYNDFLFKESIRNLYLSYNLSNVAEEFQVISITSSTSSEGKSFLNAMLANSASQLGKNVLIIDSDLRKPTMQNLFNLENIIGLSNLLTDNKLNWKNVIQKIENKDNLYVITSGPIPPDSVRLLSSGAMTKLLDSIKDSKMFDLIVLDVPPVLGMADASYAFKNVDGIALICSLENVPRYLTKEALNVINSNPNASFVGMIVNEVNDKVKNKILNRGYDNYSYYAADQDDEEINEVNQSFFKRFSAKILKFLDK